MICIHEKGKYKLESKVMFFPGVMVTADFLAAVTSNNENNIEVYVVTPECATKIYPAEVAP